MASRREMEALIVLAGRVDPTLQRALREAQGRVGGITRASNIMGKATNRAFSFMAKGAAIGAAAVGVAIVATAKKGIELASDLAEVQNVVDVTFGKDAQQINEWSKTALKSFGMSELSAKRYSSVLGAMMKSSGISNTHLVSMSENLAALSGDFASFYNLDPAEAFEKIKAGISGETEPLKALGINMTVANLQAYALSKGIKTAYAKMSQADQTILRYNYLLEASKDAQGDFMRTQDGFANQQRVLKEGFGQLAAKIMSSTLPAFTSLFKKGNQLIDSFSDDPKKIENLQNKIVSVVDKVVAAMPSAIKFASEFGSTLLVVFDYAMQLFGFVSDNWSTIAPIILGIVGAMAAWQVITFGMNAYKVIMMGIRGATLLGAAAQWAMNSAVLANPMTWIIVGIVAAVAGLVAAIIWLWKNWDEVSGWIVGLWQNNILPFFQGIGDWFSGLWTGMIDGFKLAWSGITDWFSNLWDGIVGVFKGYLNIYVNAFNFLIEKLNGINVKIPDWVPGLGGKEFGFTIPLIPTFAKGGFTNQPSIFGEAGPEAAIPLKRTPRSLSLLNKTAQILGVGGDGGSDRPTFVYAPNYGSGNVSESDMKRDFEDFKAMCEDWWESKRRESFAGV